MPDLQIVQGGGGESGRQPAPLAAPADAKCPECDNQLWATLPGPVLFCVTCGFSRRGDRTCACGAEFVLGAGWVWMASLRAARLLPSCSAACAWARLDDLVKAGVLRAEAAGPVGGKS